MPKDKKAINEYSDEKPSLRLEPEKRMCPIFDSVSIAKFPVAAPGEMGYRVLDNFCEEHIELPQGPPGVAWRADFVAMDGAM